jgi:hypothetical protein
MEDREGPRLCHGIRPLRRRKSVGGDAVPVGHGIAAGLVGCGSDSSVLRTRWRGRRQDETSEDRGTQEPRDEPANDGEGVC